MRLRPEGAAMHSGEPAGLNRFVRELWGPQSLLKTKVERQ